MNDAHRDDRNTERKSKKPFPFPIREGWDECQKRAVFLVAAIGLATMIVLNLALTPFGLYERYSFWLSLPSFFVMFGILRYAFIVRDRRKRNGEINHAENEDAR